LLLAAVLRAANPEPTRIEAEEPHMGTLFRIVLYADDIRTAQVALRMAFDRVAELDAKLSDYNPQSELMRACRGSYAEPVAVSADLFHVLEEAQKLSVETDGAFDITLGPVIRLWRQARGIKALPNPEDLARARASTGYRKLVLDPVHRTIRSKLPDMRIDLGAIAKGYAADEALRVLREHSIPRALVAASGDLAIGDAPPGKDGWDVGVDPIDAGDGKFARVLKLHNIAISTSGDAEQFVEIGGVRYSHIVDPRTGMGLTNRSGVTVVAPLGIHADSLATAATVLTAQRGVDAALAFVEQHEGAAALIAYKSASDWRISESERFRRLKETRGSTACPPLCTVQ
jgi:thiamine biosynthesis lipoprotein